MKLKEAIEELATCMSEAEKILFPEVSEAHKLGIEALKLIEATRKTTGCGSFGKLPGETK